MGKNIDKNRSDECLVPFRGAKLNKDEANQAAFALFAGIIGIVLAFIIFGKDHKLYSLVLIGFFFGRRLLRV